MSVAKEARVCSVDGCERKHHAKGLCHVHYVRNRRHGDTGTAIRKHLHGESAAVKLAAYSKAAADGSGCILWAGGKNGRGYGRMWLDGKLQQAHRVAWTEVHGEIAEGKQVDHVCNRPACVNPDHLQLVTHEQNQQLRDLRSGGFASKQTEMAAFIRLAVMDGLKVFPTDGMSVEQAAAEAAADRSQDSTEEAA